MQCQDIPAITNAQNKISNEIVHKEKKKILPYTVETLIVQPNFLVVHWIQVEVEVVSGRVMLGSAPCLLLPTHFDGGQDVEDHGLTVPTH